MRIARGIPVYIISEPDDWTAKSGPTLGVKLVRVVDVDEDVETGKKDLTLISEDGMRHYYRYLEQVYETHNEAFLVACNYNQELTLDPYFDWLGLEEE